MPPDLVYCLPVTFLLPQGKGLPRSSKREEMRVNYSENLGTLVLLLAGVVAIVAVAAVAVWRLFPHKGKKSGSKHSRIARALKNWAIPRGFKVLDDVKLVVEGRSGWADHLVVGHFGVLLAYELTVAGEYYGAPDDPKWRVKSRETWYTIENPPLHASRCVGRVRTLLHDAGIRGEVYRVAVADTSKVSTYLEGLKCPEAITYDQLRDFLSKSRFEEDLGVDVAKVTALIQSVQQDV